MTFKMAAKRPACATCPFFHDQGDDDESTGECRVAPPRLAASGPAQVQSLLEMGVAGLRRGWWPTVDAHEWCGRHPDLATGRRRSQAGPVRSA